FFLYFFFLKKTFKLKYLIFVPNGGGAAFILFKNATPRPFGYQCIILFFSPNVNTWVDFIILSIFVVVSAGFMPYIQR
ncbi:hypothetical protein, partial [Klebsiella pneumoniae]|uniref:hypothetical protein n=1 Tax=Klebsiella pneumoniae TaxID=573 RepID=UPI001B8C5FA4